MHFNLALLKKGAPSELDSSEIVLLSRGFRSRIDLQGGSNISDVKIDIQEAKVLLFRMLSKISTFIAEYYLIRPEEEIDMGFNLKFQEDIGAFFMFIRENYEKKGDEVIGRIELIRFSSELLNAYSFLIYEPLIYANRNNKSNNISDYIKNYFRIMSNNASIIGHSNKIQQLQNQIPSRLLLPSVRTVMTQGSYNKREAMMQQPMSKVDGIDSESFADIDFEEEFSIPEFKEGEEHLYSEPREEDALQFSENEDV